MTQSVADMIARYAKYAKSINPDIFQAYGEALAPAIWAEGGEWPAFSSEFVDAFARKFLRSLEVKFENPGPISSVSTFLEKRFNSASVVGLTFECGAGKSTTVVKAVHALKLGKRTVVVQPSIAVAHSLVKYMNTQAVPCICLADPDKLPGNRALAYTNAGVTLSLLAKGFITKDDIIVIDEAHVASFATAHLISVLETYGMFVLMMTASVNGDIRGRRGVKLVKVEGMTPEVSEAILVSGVRGVVVGVCEDQSYAVPAAALVGATLDLDVIYDTGLRPEPSVLRGRLVCGERRAQGIEVTQMVGRLGRSNKAGTAFYNPQAAVLNSEGVPLYDRLLEAIKSVTGYGKFDMDRETAIRVWKGSGLGAKSVPTAVLTKPSPVLGEDEFSQPSRGREASRSRSLTRTASVHGSRSASRSGSLSPAAYAPARSRPSSREGSRGTFVEATVVTVVPGGGGSGRSREVSRERRVVEVIDDEMYRSSSRSGRGQSASVVDEGPRSTSRLSVDRRERSRQRHEAEDLLEGRSRLVGRHGGDSESPESSPPSYVSANHIDGDRRVSIHGDPRYQSHFVVGKRHPSGGEPGRVRVTSSVLTVRSGQVVALRPDPTWRPFKSYHDGDAGVDTMSGAGVQSMISHLRKGYERRDMLYPAVMPRADPSVVTRQQKDDTRRIINSGLLPSFDESEVMSAVLLWNDMVVMLDGRPAQPTNVANFLDYFEKYSKCKHGQSAAV